MSTQTGEYAGPVVRGVWPSLKQNWSDLFKWKNRVEITTADGIPTHTEWRPLDRWQNPFRLLTQLTGTGWLHFLVGFFAWTADAFDFHALSIQQVKLAAYFDKSKTQISLAITLTLLLRPVGAAIFGLAGDRWGRKWPMFINMEVLGLLQIATIYCKTFPQFIAVRALFGLFMGGVYGNAVAMGLENVPPEPRGLLSGFLQQGYAFGYVLAACVNLGVGGETNSWKIVFWVAAGFSMAVGIVRLFFGESKQFLKAKEAGKTGHGASVFWHEFRKMIRKDWRMVFYCIVMMTWFNYYSHASQDNYTTFMREQKEFDNSAASRASILMKTGACVGGTILGYCSQFIGRRRAVVIAAFLSICMIPGWVLPNGEGALSATGFMMQFFVQGAWGVIPVHLNELSPPTFRSSFPGVTYQIGNMISSPAAQMVNALAETHHIKRKSGSEVEAYGPVMAIVTAILALLIILTVASGPERTGRHFEEALPAGVQNDVLGGRSPYLNRKEDIALVEAAHFPQGRKGGDQA